MTVWTLSSARSCIEQHTSPVIYRYLVQSILLSICMFLGILGLTMIDNDSDNREENLIVMFMIGQLYCVRMILFIGVLLMVGTHKIKRNVVRVYLITAACFFLLDFGMLFVGLVQEFARTVVISVSILSIEADSFLEVRRYYYEMEGMEPTHIITA